MILLIIFAMFPLLIGIVQLIQSLIKKDPKDKKHYKTYGKIKAIVGLILGPFLTFLYLSYDLFAGRLGTMIAFIVCWFIVTICNVFAHVKLGMEEYDQQQANKNEEPKDE